MSVSHWPLLYSDAKQLLTSVLKPMLQWCKVCCINNPWDKHLLQTACIIYLLGSLRSWGDLLWEQPAMYWRVSVCVCGGGAAHWHGAAVFGQRGPLCVPSTLEQKPRRSGLRFKSNKLLQHFRDDIWRYQHAKSGRGWPIAQPTRPWELPLPRLLWGDLYQCRALKYHSSAPPTPLPPVYASLDPQTDWLTHNSLSLTSCYPFFFSFHTGLNTSNCVFSFTFLG